MMKAMRGKGWLAGAGLLGMAASLSACHKGEQPPAEVLAERKDLSKIACGLDGHADFPDSCFIEMLPGSPGEGRDFLIHQGDGGFRRFAMSADGKTIAAADGALPLKLDGPKDGLWTFRVDRDSYRVPVQALAVR